MCPGHADHLGQNGQLHFLAIFRQEYFNFSNVQPMDWAASLYKTKYISERIFVQGLCFTPPYHFTDFILENLKTHKIKLRTRSEGWFLIKPERQAIINFSFLKFLSPYPRPLMLLIQLCVLVPQRGKPNQKTGICLKKAKINTRRGRRGGSFYVKKNLLLSTGDNPASP